MNNGKKTQVSASFLSKQVFYCKLCDLTPGGIIRKLGLRRPIYAKTAISGHFGVDGYPWEQTDLVPQLRAMAGLPN